MNPLPPEWLPRSNAVNLLAGAFLLSALYAAAQRRALSAVAAYRLNSVALGLIALVVAFATGSRQVALAALLIAAIKAIVLPALLARRVRRGRGAATSEPRTGVPAGMLACVALAVVGFGRARALLGPGLDILASCLPVSLAGTLVGLFVMVSRREAVMQVVGLVLVENAIFLAAVSLAYGMPLLAGIGVLLDLIVGVVLYGPFAGRIEATHGDTGTSRLTDPRG